MSLQTGQPLGRLAAPIIDPYTLRIVAFYVEGPRLDFSPAVLFTDDIREFGRLGAIVNSVDNIMSTDGLVRLNEIISCNRSFKLRDSTTPGKTERFSKLIYRWVVSQP